MEKNDVLSQYYKQILCVMFLNVEDGGVQSTGVKFYDDLSELIGKYFTNEELEVIAHRSGPTPDFYKYFLNA